MIALKQAVATLDGVIPPPDNNMVDVYHFPIAMAWHECKEALAIYEDMKDKHDTLMNRWEAMVEIIRKKIDAGTLTGEDSRLLDALNLPHRYDKRTGTVIRTMKNLAYQDILPEINKVCKAHPGCWHTPTSEVDCQYIDVCRAKYEGPDNGNAAFEAAVLARYKELRRNPPLTLEELREMDGEPVWIASQDGRNESCWMLVDAEYNLCREAHGGMAVFENNGKTWMAYRRKPESEAGML